MSSQDLSLALVVAHVAMTKDVSWEQAIKFIGDDLTKPMKKGRARFVHSTLPVLENATIDPLSTLREVKAVCIYTPSAKTVRSLRGIHEMLANSKWSVTFYKMQCSMCYLEESLLLAFTASFTLSLHQRQTKEVLIDIVCLLFSRIDEDKRTLTSYLVGILGQLVFLLSFEDDCEHEFYVFFMSLNGIAIPKKTLSKTVTNMVKVVASNEVLMFHMEIIRIYCHRYDTASMKDIRKQIMACLFVHGEQEVLEFARALFL